MGKTPLDGDPAPVSASSPTMTKLSSASSCSLAANMAQRNWQIETRSLLFHVGAGADVERAAHWEFEA